MQIISELNGINRPYSDRTINNNKTIATSKLQHLIHKAKTCFKGAIDRSQNIIQSIPARTTTFSNLPHPGVLSQIQTQTSSRMHGIIYNNQHSQTLLHT